VILQLVQFGAQAALGVTGQPPRSSAAIGAYLGRSFSASAIVLVIGLILGAILTGILFTVLRGALIGRRTDLGTAWKAAMPKVPGLIGVSVLLGLFIAVVAVVGFGLAVGLGVGIGGGVGAVVGILLGIAALVLLVYVGVLLSLATAAYVLEDIGVVAALTRSRDLVRGAWLQIFGVLLVAVLIFSVIGGILGAIAGFAGAANTLTTGATPGIGFTIAIGLASVVVTTFATPYFAGLTGLLYVDQRIRRERYDLQLATWAAGR